MKKLLFIGLVSFLNLSASVIEHVDLKVRRQATAGVWSASSCNKYTDFQKRLTIGSIGMLFAAGALGYQSYDLQDFRIII